MAQYCNINVNLPKFQLNKVKPPTENATDVTLRLSSNMIVTNNLIST